MSTVVQGVLLAVIGVLLFGLIIFIHEFGHFFTAKLSHVCVNEFSIGMGPLLWKSRRGIPFIAFGSFPSAATVPWKERTRRPVIPRPLRSSRCGRSC